MRLILLFLMVNFRYTYLMNFKIVEIVTVELIGKIVSLCNRRFSEDGHGSYCFFAVDGPF